MIFQNLSIKRKLTLITMLTSSAALVLSALSFLVYDLVSFRHLLIQDLKTQSEIIGYNSAGRDGIQGRACRNGDVGGPDCEGRRRSRRTLRPG